MAERPTVSVVIPTYNRRGALIRLLDALGRQTYSPQKIEVIVAVDGSSDDTVDALAAYAAPYSLRWLELPNGGQAIARNAGARAARAPLLLFLDDDVEPVPGLVEAHLCKHNEQGGRVVIGSYPMRPSTTDGWLRMELRSWWQGMFDIMAEPGHRFAYTDLLSGNFSLPAELFWRVGGFKPSLSAYHCREDYELGMRLIETSAEFCHAPDAVAYHEERSDLRRLLCRKRAEGQADVVLVRLHPSLFERTLLSQRRAPLPPLDRALRALAFRAPPLADRLAGAVVAWMGLAKALHLRGRWRIALDRLMTFWYWRGVADQLPQPSAFDELVAAGTVPCATRSLAIDLADGLDHAEAAIDRERPEELLLHYGGYYIGTVAPVPGAEPLRGAHLRSLLMNDLASPTVHALARASLVDPEVDSLHLLPRFLTQTAE